MGNFKYFKKIFCELKVKLKIFDLKAINVT